MRFRWIVIAACVLLLAPGIVRSAESLVHSRGVEADDDLDDLYLRLAEAYRELDTDRAAELYATDAIYLPPDRPIQRGRRAVAQSFEALFARAAEDEEELEISFRIMSREVTDEMAYDVGIYVLERYRQGEEVEVRRGKFVIVAVRDEEERWRFRVESISDLEARRRAAEEAEPEPDPEDD